MGKKKGEQKHHIWILSLFNHMCYVGGGDTYRANKQVEEIDR